MIKNFWLCLLLFSINSFASETMPLDEIEEGILIFEKFEHAYIADTDQEMPTEYPFAELNLRITLGKEDIGQRLCLFNLDNGKLLTSLVFDHLIAGIEMADKKLRISIRSPEHSEIATANFLRYKYRAGSLEPLHNDLLERIVRKTFKQVSRYGAEPKTKLSTIDKAIFKRLPAEIIKAFAPYVEVDETESPSKPRRPTFYF